MPAPTKLIGYVSAGSIETPGGTRPRRMFRGRRRHVVLLALLLAAIRVFF